MNISRTTTLSQKKREDMRLIADLCRREEGLTLSCPEDGDEFWLLEENGRTAAWITVYKMDENMWECYAFTRRDCRGRGYFSALLEQLCSRSESCGEPDLCFVTDNRCPAALAALHSLEAELAWEEYMMEYRITEARLQVLPHDSKELDLTMSVAGESQEMGLAGEPQGIGAASGDIPAAFLSSPAAPLSISAWEPGHNGTGEAAVTCRLSLRGNTAYLYSLETSPLLRRQGLAFRFLGQLLRLLADAECRVLRLQVSGSNTAALELYRKTGFQLTETLSYYLY